MDWSHLVGLLGPLAIAVTLWILARLSERLGRVTHARPYYRGLYVAAALVGLNFLLRAVNIFAGFAVSEELNQNILWIVVYNGLPALAVTLAILVAWYYWSWLLAERD
jgi:hypothetical protein